jgi:hypothetical protein
MTDEEVIKEIENIRKFNYTLAPDEVFDRAIAAIKECKGKSIDTSAEENEDQVVELYCTDCPYFMFTGEPTDYWYGARCNKDGHEVSPSMMAIQELNDNCPVNRGVNE